jgi:hypothetical protein
MAKVLCVDGVERWQFHVKVGLSDDELSMLRKVAKKRGWPLSEVLHGCFAEGLEDLGARIDDELDEEGE